MLKAIRKRQKHQEKPAVTEPTDSTPGSIPPDATDEEIHEAVEHAFDELQNAADRHTELAKNVKRSGFFTSV